MTVKRGIRELPQLVKQVLSRITNALVHTYRGCTLVQRIKEFLSKMSWQTNTK